MEVKVLKDILGANDAQARKNRERLDRHNILAINVMSSPGSGKTSLVVQTIRKLHPGVRMAVIEGDVASTIDADRVHKEGVPAIQINTGGGCHLDANMIENALNNLSLGDIDLLIIENVGNLICPAEFALGEHKRVMLLSVPEGDDKPHKYPTMFTEADVVVVNKIDLLPYSDFNVEAVRKAVTGLNPDVKMFQVSCKTGEGVVEWTSWLLDSLKKKQAGGK